jgi:pyrroline-5-carboxylate reductase
MSKVLNEIKSSLPPGCLLISVAAGLSLSWFSKYCGKHQAIIRTMPNTAASLGLSATPIIANEFTTPAQIKQAELIFSQIGLTTWTKNEEDMDTFTALSGSGPAYVFLFMEAMIDAAVALGLDESIARTFTLQTFNGALKLVQNSDLSLTQLRTKVTSPGGTTAAALSILHEKLDVLIFDAMKAAKHRAHELGSAE